MVFRRSIPKRASRAGADSHPSGNRVVHNVQSRPIPPEPTEEVERVTTVTLPKLKFLERKKIAGEMI